MLTVDPGAVVATESSRALQDDYNKTSGSFESSGTRIHSLVVQGERPILALQAAPGSMQEEDCMQETSTQEEMALNNHRDVGLDQVITWWPNLLNASLYPINRHLSRSDAGL